MGQCIGISVYFTQHFVDRDVSAEQSIEPRWEDLAPQVQQCNCTLSPLALPTKFRMVPLAKIHFSQRSISQEYMGARWDYEANGYEWRSVLDDADPDAGIIHFVHMMQHDGRCAFLLHAAWPHMRVYDLQSLTDANVDVSCYMVPLEDMHDHVVSIDNRRLYMYRLCVSKANIRERAECFVIVEKNEILAGSADFDDYVRYKFDAGTGGEPWLRINNT